MNKEQMQKIVNTLSDIDRQIFACKSNLIYLYDPEKIGGIENAAFYSIMVFVNLAGQNIEKAIQGMKSFGFEPKSLFSEEVEIKTTSFLEKDETK